jgi:putative transposon-encoded protein
MVDYSYIMPRKVDFEPATRIEVNGVIGFMRRKVTAYGTGAKVTCPKEYLGKTVYLVITDEPAQPQLNHESAASGAESKDE